MACWRQAAGPARPGRKSGSGMMELPVCQFGPGGDFVELWPAPQHRPSAERAGVSAEAATANHKPAVPPVSTGPWWRAWQRAATVVAAAVGWSAWTLKRTFADLQGEGSPRKGRQKLGAREKLLAEGCAQLAKVRTLPQRGQPVIGGLRDDLMAARAEQESEDADTNAETTGDSAIHSRLSQSSWLFPDHAGNWGPSSPDKGHRLRARRGSGKKRAAPSGRQAQGSLFAGISEL